MAIDDTVPATTGTDQHVAEIPPDGALRLAQHCCGGFLRAGVIILHEHVVCFHNDENGGFRFYDNDSPARLEGRPQILRADEMLDKTNLGLSPTVIGILKESSDLSRRLGPALTTLVTQRVPRRRPPAPAL